MARLWDLGERLLEELDRLHPFGQGNPEPCSDCRHRAGRGAAGLW